MRRSLRHTVPLLLLALATGPAGATTMIGLNLDALTTRSVSVVRATTIATRSEWDDERRIVTFVRLRALESLKGTIAAGQEFEVRTLGGRVGELTMSIVGGATYAAGEEVVLFLRRDVRGGLETVDLAQGKFEVGRDAEGRQRLTRNGLAAVDWYQARAPQPIGDLGTLRARVVAAVRSSQQSR